jgi:serine/threonine-protein kinase
MADIFVAEDRRLQRRVAVKVMHGQFAASDAFVARFRREAQAAGNLTHPNVVSIYDWGEDGGIYYMVMELIEGRDLRTVLKSTGPLSPTRVARIGIEVAAALAAAHEIGLVHRDTKPANILITKEGGVKVTDFGIARAWDDTEQLTRTGSVMGTATYFSPEQAQGLACDGRSDIYSLGVVLYELVTGRPPFTGDSPVSVAYQHVREEAPPPSAVNPDVPPVLSEIIMRCLAKDPADRYQSAGRLIADLQRFLAGASAHPVSDDAPTRVLPGLTPTSIPTGSEPPPPPQPPQVSRSTAEYPDDTYAPPGGVDRLTLVLGILGGIGILLIGVVLLMRLLSPGETIEVTIPDVSGMERSAAIELLQELDLRTTEVPIPDPDVDSGFVIRTDPPAGEVVDGDSEVRVFVSTGPGEVEVPRVVDLDEEEARAALADAGLEIGEITTEASPVIEAGIVIAQRPGAGETVPAGSSVDLVISTGDTGIEVPDVTGRAERDALLQLSEAGFTPDQIRVERKPDGEILEGFVIETDPPAGQFVAEGSVVTVFISEGAVPTVVPDMTGLDPEDALEQLEDLGFVVEFGEPVEVELDDPDDGRVVEQDPEAGVLAEFGSTVTLRVGQAPGPVEVPELVGLEVDEARAAVESAGLVFVVEEQTVEVGDPLDGTVVDQDPEAGTEVAPDTEITVTVATSKVEVPNVIGMTVQEARAAIEAAVLEFQQGEDITEEVPVGDPLDGFVGQQSPPFTAEVPPGTVVTVRVVSAPVLVPDVLGDDLASAQQAIVDAGLRFTYGGTILLAPGDTRVGRVVDQSPDGGIVVPKDTEVVVFEGIEGVVVPDVIGLTKDLAKQQFLGLALDVELVCVNDFDNAGFITDQDPPGGLVVAQNSSVRLVLAKRAADACPVW